MIVAICPLLTVNLTLNIFSDNAYEAPCLLIKNHLGYL